MNLIIRDADLEADALSIMEGAKDFIARMDYTDFLPADDDALTEAVGRIVTMDGIEFLVAEHEGRIVGGIALLIAPLVWNPAALVADELFWWVDGKAPATVALRLLRASVGRARARGARFAQYKALTSSPPALDRVYRRIGLRPVEAAYMGAL